MADGIRINDAAAKISPAGLNSLLNNQGADVRVTKLDLSVSPDALNALLAALAPAAGPDSAKTTASVSEGRLDVNLVRDGKPTHLDLSVGGIRIELTADGLRLVTG